MRCGSLNNKVTIKAPSRNKNEFGEAETTWVEVAKAWASIDAIKAELYLSAAKEQHDITHKVVMRYNSLVKPNCRIYHENRVFKVVSLRDPGERKKMMILLCKEEFDG